MLQRLLRANGQTYLQNIGKWEGTYMAFVETNSDSTAVFDSHCGD